MNYVGLATRSYGEGRICIFTDRIGGYRTGHGDNLIYFWRSIFEWAGQRKNTETIHVGIIESTITNYEKRLSQVPNIIFEPINLQYIASCNIEKFDLLYFIGLPEKVADDVHTKLQNYVENGRGMIVETPDRGEEPINVLLSMDYIYCLSQQRPLYQKAYWSAEGLNSYIYTPDVLLYFMTTIQPSTFSSDWSVLMSDIPVTLEKDKTLDTTINEIETVGNAQSEFGVSFVTAMQNGLIEIKMS